MKLITKSRVAKLFGVFLCLVLFAVFAFWLWFPKPSITADIVMNDGVSLRTYVFNPSGEGPWPVVLMRTPYGYTMMTTLFPPKKYTSAGYSFILQSCRGTGDSGGDYSSFSHARPDAKDTLDWIDSQPFSNDKVGLSGASAMGITANMAASLQHPTVKATYVAIAPQSSFTEATFMVKLVDVYPDGYEALLLDAPIRARYRNGRNAEDVMMMTPGVPEKMTIDLWSTANTFEKGHRIAVHVTSSNAPRFEVNPNTGHQPGGSREETRIATNSIYHIAEKASAIILPILLTVDAQRTEATETSSGGDSALQSTGDTAIEDVPEDKLVSP